MWAGATFSNRYSAPFQVFKDGSFVATNATITGIINSNSGSIGGFSIASQQIGVPNNSDGFTLIPSLIKYSVTNSGSTGETIFAGFGTDVLPASSGVIALARFEYSDTSGYSTIGYALHTKFRPNYQDPSLSQQAINNDGNVFSIGGHCLFDDTFCGTIYTNTIQQYISRTTTFVVQGVSTTGTLSVHLPTQTAINVLTGNRDVTFLLHITLALGASSNSINLIPDPSDTHHILDNNGNNLSGITMSKGDTLILRYYAGNYYVISHLS